MYTYFVKAERNEHYLSARELASLLYLFGYRTKSGNPLASLVRAYLSSKAQMRGEEAFYYKTSKGLMRVYPHGSDDLKELLEEMDRRLAEANGKDFRMLIEAGETSSPFYHVGYEASADVRLEAENNEADKEEGEIAS